jgi:hypothetical protein
MMDDWQRNSFSMLYRLKTHRAEHPGEIPVWLKIRIDPTMPEHAIIDRYLENLGSTRNDFEFEKYESGPEIMAHLAVTVVAVSLAKEVISLVTTIIKARSDIHKKRDLAAEPIEVIARRIDEGHGLTDEVILRIGQKEAENEVTIEQRLTEALRKIAKRKM